MTPAKNRDSDESHAAIGGPLAWLPRLFRGRTKLVLWTVAIVAIVVGGRYVWNRVREHVAARDDYRLTANEISITAPPPWVHADVKAEVMHNALGGESLSILDDGLVEQIQQAFSLHPWIAKVERVSKSHPAHVEVEIVYRRPMAMVQVTGGLLPVDIDGVLLPCNDFSPAEAGSYPRLTGIESSPMGPLGTKWGDPVVTGGAKIGAALESFWGELGLRNIRWLKPAPTSDPSAPAFYDLITAGGNVVPWGAPPGSELPGEPTASVKVLRLKGYIAQHGSLDEPPSGPKDFDLRREDSAPRTAARAN